MNVFQNQKYSSLTQKTFFSTEHFTLRMSEDEIAVITDDTEMGKMAAPISNTEDVEHSSEENMSSEDEIVAASRYEFEIKPDHFIFDFQDVESEDDMIQEEEPNEDEGNEDGEEEEEDENEKDGMEDEAADDDNMTEQQQVLKDVWYYE